MVFKGRGYQDAVQSIKSFFVYTIDHENEYQDEEIEAESERPDSV